MNVYANCHSRNYLRVSMAQIIILPKTKEKNISTNLQLHKIIVTNLLSVLRQPYEYWIH